VRRALLAAKDPGETSRPVAALEQILKEEIALTRRLHAIRMRDSRIGFEASNHYFCGWFLCLPDLRHPLEGVVHFFGFQHAHRDGIHEFVLEDVV